ncbi:MAG: coproporphyrinogen III oxidase, partial [Deltaproteobacteria bacterium]|nr:coproporphyrinogen III oxidase [Deltaproteobacteria bacterium]
MLVERVMTAYLKRKYSSVLSFDSFDPVSPALPEPGRDYLLYVHIPFCEELCPYCSFNRVPLQVDMARE